MSVSSLVSYSRRHIHEEIPGMQNAFYDLVPSKGNEPTILYVEDSFYYKPDIEGNQDRIRVTSEEIVASLVHMHITSQLLYTVEQHPALFCIPNEQVTRESLVEKYKKELLLALARQKRWFIALVKLADDDWQQVRRHQMISDIQRTAAMELGLRREWLLTVEDENANHCPFCGNQLLHPDAPICPHCHKVHNPAKMKELELKLAVAGKG